MKEIVRSVVEKHYSGKFLWFRGREIGQTFNTSIRLTCDICGFSEEGEEYIGLYSGKWDYPFLPKTITDFTWGYKHNTLQACKTHTEKEIEKKISELKNQD